MKILFSSLSGALGGVETFVLAFAKWLRARGVEVGFLTSSPDMYFADELSEIGCKIHIVDCSRRENPFGYKRALKKFFDRTDYDVFYNNTCSASFIEHVRQAKKHGLLCVTHSHSAWKGKGLASVLHKLHKHKLCKMTDVAFACSDLAGKWLFDSGLVKYEFVQNGIDLPKYVYSDENRHAVRNKYGISDFATVIGHVGSLNYFKNQKFILEIADKLIKDGRNVKVMLVGDGGDREMLTNRVKELGIEDSVVFTGNLNNINEVLSAFDVFVFPSLFEGLPISVIEAQANGVPVVISDSITDLVKVAPNVTDISLDADINVWCDGVVKSAGADRLDNTAVLKAAGYDSDDVYSKIYEKIAKKA